MSAFDITKSGFNVEKLEDLEVSLRDEGFPEEIETLSGVGPKSAIKLKSAGMANSYQLVAKYLSFCSLNKDNQAASDEFWRWYKGVTGEGGHAHKVTAHLIFALHFGMKHIDVTIPDEMKDNEQLDKSKVKEFCAKELDPKLEAMPGIGPKSIAKLAGKGITSTRQLCGLFLNTLDPKAFSETLKEFGVAASWSLPVAYLIALKCQKGGIQKELTVTELTEVFKKL